MYPDYIMNSDKEFVFVSSDEFEKVIEAKEWAKLPEFISELELKSDISGKNARNQIEKLLGELHEEENEALITEVVPKLIELFAKAKDYNALVQLSSNSLIRNAITEEAKAVLTKFREYRSMAMRLFDEKVGTVYREFEEEFEDVVISFKDYVLSFVAPTGVTYKVFWFSNE